MKTKIFTAATACLVAAGALMSFTFSRVGEFKVLIKNDTDNDYVIYHKEGSGRLYHGSTGTYYFDSGEKLQWAPDDSPNDKEHLLTVSDDMSGKTLKLSEYLE